MWIVVVKRDAEWKVLDVHGHTKYFDKADDAYNYVDAWGWADAAERSNYRLVYLG